MNTNTFGTATAFAYSSVDNVAQVSEGLQSFQRQLLQGFFAQNGRMTATTSPRLSVTAFPTDLVELATDWRGRSVLQAPELAGTMEPAPTAAQQLVEEIRRRSGLHLEEIATVVGTSRRSVQNWRSGERVNSRNEDRLRDLADAIRLIDGGDPLVTRNRLLQRTDGQLSAYALLTEQRYDTAVAVATGRQPVRAEPRTGEGLRPEIAARLLIMPGSTPLDAGTRSKRRLRRKSG